MCFKFYQDENSKTFRTTHISTFAKDLRECALLAESDNHKESLTENYVNKIAV